MEKYSVLMSVYAKVSPKDLEISIGSMMNQTYKPDQFILVLDGPVGDELKTVVTNYVERYPTVFSVIPLVENYGLAYALNKGLEVSRNELVARMDSDDYSLPERCERQVKAFESDSELVLLGTNIRFFKDTPSNLLDMTRTYPTDVNSIRRALRRIDPFSHPTVMYKKGAVLSCGGYDPKLRRRQDYDLFSMMVVNKGYKAENLPEILLLFRADDDYRERNKSKESCNNRILIQKRIYKRGDCSIADYFYVWVAMTLSKILPTKLYGAIYSWIKK